MKKWLKAAERYEASKKPGFRPRRRKESKIKTPPPPSLSDFLESEEWSAGSKLLKASEQDITIAISEECMSRTDSVVLEWDGLKSINGVVGMASAYSQEKPKTEPLLTEEAVKRTLDYNVSLESEDAIIILIRLSLDEIAEKAP